MLILSSMISQTYSVSISENVVVFHDPLSEINACTRVKLPRSTILTMKLTWRREWHKEMPLCKNNHMKACLEFAKSIIMTQLWCGKRLCGQIRNWNMYWPSCNYLLALFNISMARFNQTELNNMNQRRRFGGPRWSRRIRGPRLWDRKMELVGLRTYDGVKGIESPGRVKHTEVHGWAAYQQTTPRPEDHSREGF